MVVINRGFGEFKLADDVSIVACPHCKSSSTLVLWNIGFVKCVWSIKGMLNMPNGTTTPVLSMEGKCYDSCLYTMKEIDMKWTWAMLRVSV